MINLGDLWKTALTSLVWIKMKINVGEWDGGGGGGLLHAMF